MIGAMISAAAAVFVLPASSAAEAEGSKLVYAIPVAVPAALPYLALEKGYFREEGLEVEARMFSSGREGLEALLAGQAQVQTVSETPVVHAIIQGNEIVTVATVSRHSEAKLIARRDRGIVKPEDLKGKRVATLPGTNSDYFMHEFLEKYGMTADQLHVANMRPPEMVLAYAKGDIDAYFAWEPHIYYGRKQFPGESVVFLPGDLYRGWSTVNMDPRFVRAHPGTVRRLLRALLKAEDFARRHPREAVRLLARRLDMDPEVLENLWREIVFKVELDRGLPELEGRIGLWSMRLSGVDGPLPDFRRHIDEKALAEVKPAAVRL